MGKVILFPNERIIQASAQIFWNRRCNLERFHDMTKREKLQDLVQDILDSNAAYADRLQDILEEN